MLRHLHDMKHVNGTLRPITYYLHNISSIHVRNQTDKVDKYEVWVHLEQKIFIITFSFKVDDDRRGWLHRCPCPFLTHAYINSICLKKITKIKNFDLNFTKIKKVENQRGSQRLALHKSVHFLGNKIKVNDMHACINYNGAAMMQHCNNNNFDCMDNGWQSCLVQLQLRSFQEQVKI